MRPPLLVCDPIEHAILLLRSGAHAPASAAAGEQLDASNDTFAALPTVIGATLSLVCLILAIAFRAIVAPSASRAAASARAAALRA